MNHFAAKTISNRFTACHIMASSVLERRSTLAFGKTQGPGGNFPFTPSKCITETTVPWGFITPLRLTTVERT